MTVKLRDTATNFILTLEPWQETLFLQELGSVVKTSARHGFDVTIEPFCLIEVIPASGQQSEYELLGRSIIMERKDERCWPFYFGMLLAEWLARARPRLRPGKPFRPAVP